MDYEKLKEVIAKKIKENGRGEITGPILQAVLMAMVDSLGEVYPQTYTDEQKAQARANIDALANYDGEITKEKLSAEVQAILEDVPNKQNITDESLTTIAKTIVGAINEVYKGGLEDGSIATNKIEDGAVTTDKIADAAVTEDKLALQSVSSKKIKDATIGASKLGDNSVTITKIKSGAVTEPKIADNAITSSKIEYGAVTTDKIANKAVTESKIKNEAVTEDKIANYSISMSKLRKANLDYFPDLGSAVYHSLHITLAYNGRGGSLTLSCNGVTWTSMRDATKVIEHVMSSTGIGVTLYISEPLSSSSKKRYVGTVVGVSTISEDEEISAIIRDGYDTNYTFNKDYFVVIKDYKFTTKICLTDQLPKIASLETDVTSLLGKVGINVKVLPKGTNLLSADLEDGIWLVTEPNSYTNPPSWFSGNGIAILAVDKTSNNVILIGHDNSSNELPAWASRYLSSTSGWRGANKDLEEIFAKKSEIGIKKLPKNTDLYDDTAIENGILYTLYVDYYGNPHPFYTNFPEKMNNGRPALLFRVDDKVCIIGADSKKDFPFYAWRNVGELKMWAYTSIADQFNYALQIGSYLSDTEINNIWDNN